MLIWTAREETRLPIARAELLDVLRAVLDITTGIGVARAVHLHCENSPTGSR
ncbi:MAG TPA: hypothetical protein VF771_08375 [Longimicrobiaceae bacterium]